MQPTLDNSRNRRNTSLVLVAAAGLLMCGSIFSRFVYGPMGGEIIYFEILRHNLSWDGAPMLIVLWPATLGALEAICALLSLAILHRVGPRLHWITLDVFLHAVSLTQIGFIWWYSGMAGFARRELSAIAIAAAGVIVSLLLASILVRSAERRSAVVRLIGSAWVIVSLWPVTDWTPLDTIFWAYGPGYWMLIGGALLLAFQSVRSLKVLQVTASA